MAYNRRRASPGESFPFRILSTCQHLRDPGHYAERATEFTSTSLGGVGTVHIC